MRLNKISKIIDNALILDDVTLRLPKKQLIAFIGPNGAGKSTLFSILSRIDKKTGGTYSVDGTLIEEWSTKDLAKKLALLPQQVHFDISLTVRELVSFGRYPYSQGHLNQEDVQIIEEALAYMSCQEIANRDIKSLSGGQFQRVLVAMIIAQNTDYILLDEPLNNLDIKQSIVTMNLLRGLVDEREKTIVVVIHDIQMAAKYADYLVAFKEGKVFAEGPTLEVMQDEILSELYETPLEVIHQNNQFFLNYKEMNR